MPRKSEFLDYEPLSRKSREAHPVGVQSEHDWRSQTPAVATNVETDSPFERDSAPVPHVVQNVEKVTSGNGNTLLKNGHRLSFIGLFLFSLVVYVRPYEYFPALKSLQNMAFVLAMATLAIFLPTQLGLEGKLTIRPREVNLVLLLLAAALLSVPQALDPLIAWNGFVDYFKIVLMFIVLVNVVRTEGRLKLLFLLVLVVSGALSISAISDYAAGRLELGGMRIKGMFGGLFDNPNDLALHLVTIIPIAIALLFGSRSLFKKLFYAACAILMAAGVVVTFSRGGLLGLVCMGGVLAWRVGRRNKWLIIMALPLILAGFIILAPGGYGSRITTTGDESAASRIDDLKRSVFISVRHPLLGVGLGNYVLFSNTNHATHNSYTQVSSELGLAAMLIYVLFQIAPLKELRKVTRETSDTRRKSHYYYLAVGLEASLIGYMVASFFASVAFLWYVYFLVGYAVCLVRLYKASDENLLVS